MTEVQVLIQGYAKNNDSGWLSSSSVTLVKSNGKNIIVDPGCNRQKLIEGLKNNGLTPDDIDYIFCTHNHTDHILLVGMFPNAKVLNDTEMYDGDRQVDHSGIIPDTDCKIIATPGHDQFHAALIVPTKKGVFALAGDVFWWFDDEAQQTDRKSLLNRADPFVKDEKVLKESRKKILKIANYIIPGHGKMFKVEGK